ncbi:MAG: NAD(P)/FAD-dependent oxidoreductase [Thaumarchaeota archaeon]|nr:NAD(P)/FAD-dependent oxidoreductase [Nitrososphaerota archaeon]
MSGKTVLILGGGVGGLVASNVLREKVGAQTTIRLVERKRQFQFPPSYPWLMLGQRKPEQVQKDLGLLKKKGIEVVNDEVESIDIDGKVVKGKENDDLSYDYLIIALGAEYAPDAIPGFKEHAHHIYDLDSAVRFKEAVEKFERGTIAVGVSRTPFKCPAAPYETALLLEDYYSKKGMRDRVKFEFFTPEGNPVPAVGAEIGSKVAEFLKSKNISYHPKLKVTEIRDGEARFESGEQISFDLLFCVPPHKAPKPVVDAKLTDETGWIPVKPRTLETKHNGIYAVGDVTSLPTPKGYMPFLPKAGVFAHGQAEVVANNIAVQIKGRGKVKEWDGHGSCFLEVGHGESAFVKGRFLAEPKPEIEFHMPGKVWHMQKVLFEKYWMRHWF